MKDFTELAAGPLRLPIGGVLYTIPPIDIPTGLLLRRTLDPEDVDAIKELSGDDEMSAYRRVLGAALDEMVADGVSLPAMERAYLTALTDHHKGRVIAELVWEVGHDPKALRDWVEAGARIAKSGAASDSRTPRQGNSRRTTTSPGAKRKPTKRAHAASSGAA